MKSKNWLIVLIPVVFLVLLVVLWRGLGNDPRALPSALEGKPMPAFIAETLEGTAQPHTAMQGPALLNVWATWCPTCKQEHDYLNQLKASGVPIYGLNYKDDTANARQWLADNGSPYQLTWLDTQGQVGIDLGVYGAPETFLIGENGNILARHAGEMTEKVWQQKFATYFSSSIAGGEQ